MRTNAAEEFLSLSRSGEYTLVVRLLGRWRVGSTLPSSGELKKKIEASPGLREIQFDAGQLAGWDSGLLTFLMSVRKLSPGWGITFKEEGLPEGVRRLLALASAVPEKKDARKEAVRERFLARVGSHALHFVNSASEMLAFTGEASIAFMKLLRGKTRFRRSDLTLFMQESGAQALSIVSLISLLVGLIFAFIGAVQLEMFGAQIYVANLVGIAMARVMGAVMVGIIMAGRTGSAFAAQLGTMQVNEEIDALITLGISPMEFLVLPRMLALTLMMPLLCLYSDLMGILGGFIVGVTILDIGIVQYYQQTQLAVTLSTVGVGLFHSVVFGVLVALAGCLRGIQCGRSASAVGDAATSAVVTSIVSIVVATAIITVACNVLGI